MRYPFLGGRKSMTGLDKKVYEVLSDKYQVKGQIIDYGFVIKLQFAYAGKRREIALSL